MGLFGKKDPCPICGNQVKGLLPTKVEGQAICKECSKSIDLPDGALNRMTISDVREINALLCASQWQIPPATEITALWHLTAVLPTLYRAKDIFQTESCIIKFKDFTTPLTAILPTQSKIMN